MEQDIEPHLIRGNVAIKTSADTGQYGDGSLEVEGKIYSDTIQEYTTNNGTTVEGVRFNNNYIQVSAPSVSLPASAPSGTILLYYDTTTKKYRTLNVDGYTNAVVTTKGELITHDGTKETTLAASTGTNGDRLILDSTTTPGLRWQTPPNFIDRYYYRYALSSVESSTTSTNFIAKATVTSTLPAGTYRVGVSYNWRMGTGSRLFRARVLLDGTTTIYEQYDHSTGSGNIPNTILQVAAGTAIVSLTAASHTVQLQFCSGTGVTAYISNAVVELWKLT